MLPDPLSDRRFRPCCFLRSQAGRATNSLRSFDRSRRFLVRERAVTKAQLVDAGRSGGARMVVLGRGAKRAAGRGLLYRCRSLRETQSKLGHAMVGAVTTGQAYKGARERPCLER